MVFISADYSQIELRILAHLSKDPALVEAFSRGEDVHSATAKLVFPEFSTEGSNKSELRRAAKTINFGIIYGMGPHKLAQSLGISHREAESFISAYFERFSGVKEYFASIEREIETLGYVETILGRRRGLSDIARDERDGGYARRALLNFPLQGSAADIIKVAMISFDKALSESGLKARLLLQVHDELLVEASAEQAEQIQDMLVSQMESAIKLNVPLKVDCKLGDSWSKD